MSEQNPATPPFVIHKEYVKDLSFEMPSAPKIFFDKNIESNSEINIEINASKINENLFNLDLHLVVSNKNKEETLFLVDMTYSALTSVNIDNDDEVKKVLLINIPYIIFPSVITLVANLTRESGFPALILAPVNFEEMFKNSNQVEKPKDN